MKLRLMATVFGLLKKGDQEFYIGRSAPFGFAVFAGKEAVEIGSVCRVLESWLCTTEAARACLSFAFQRAGSSEVYSFTSLLNLPSQVMQKLGMEFVKEFDSEKVPADSPLLRHVLYRIEFPLKRQVFP